MSRPPSLRRLLVQVALLAGVLVGLSRLAGRPAPPAAGGAGEAAVAGGTAPAAPADQPSSTTPDLTFYRTLGDGRAPGGIAPMSPGREDAPVRPAATPPAGAGAYVVQAFASRDAEAARRVRDRLAARGFPATVSGDRESARPVYRVRVGRYRTRPEAEAAARVLRQKHHLSPWILQEED